MPANCVGRSFRPRLSRFIVRYSDRQDGQRERRFATLALACRWRDCLNIDPNVVPGSAVVIDAALAKVTP
jgi:hypothetical protein